MANSDESTEKALARRIRQRVIGRPQAFFAVTLPGLEPLCRAELAALPDAPGELAVDKGGIAFNGRLTACYQANLMCRTATRILMRIARFKAMHFGTLERHVQAIDWSLYLQPDAAVAVQVSARQSKLYHSQAVAERIRQAVLERMSGSTPLPDEPPGRPSQNLYVRLHKDRVTLSLDSSGSPLYKRGLKTQGGPAPLRETLAAAALMLAGYDGRVPLCDPMTGSGTFALEAAMIRRQIPPGWYRSFAFTEWPGFREAHWHYLRAQAAPPARPGPEPGIFASDRSRTAVDLLQRVLTGSGLVEAVDLQRQDFFDLQGSKISPDAGLVALNPPYGRRLGKPGTAPRLVGELLRKLQQDFRGWRVVMVLPEEHLLRQFPFAVTSHRVMHGGKPVWLAIGDLPS